MTKKQDEEKFSNQCDFLKNSQINELEYYKNAIIKKKQQLSFKQNYYKIFPTIYQNENLTFLVHKKEPQNFINDIFSAIEEGNIQSVIWILANESSNLSEILSQRKNGLTPLHYAVLKNNLEIVMFLLAKGADLESKTSESVYFVPNAQISQIIQDIIDDANKEKQNEENQYQSQNSIIYDEITPLHIAVIQSNFDIIQFLCEHYSANVNTTDSNQNNSILFSSLLFSYSNPQIIDYLLKKRADPNVANKLNISPILMSIYSNNIQLFDMLIQNGTNITDQIFETICRKDLLDFCDLILTHTDYNVKSSILLTAFQQNWSLNIIQLILTKKESIDINSTSFNYETPLLECIKNNNKNYFYFLLSLGGVTNQENEVFSNKFDDLDFNCCDINERNALHYAVINKNYDFIKILIENGCDINSVDVNDQTPIHLAFISNDYDLILFIFNKIKEQKVFININAQDKNKQTYLHYSVINNQIKFVEMLLNDANVNINVIDYFGKMPFIYCLEQFNIDIINLFLQNEPFNINISFPTTDKLSQNQINISPLLYVLENGRIDLFVIFMQKNGDLFTVDSNKASFLHYAAKSGNQFLLTCFFDWIGNNKANLSNEDLEQQESKDQLLDSLRTNLNIYFSDPSRISYFYYDNNKRSPIHYCSSTNCIQSLNLFLNKGCELNEADANGTTPLMTAAFTNSIDVLIRILQVNKYYINSVDQMKRTALNYAILGNNIEIVKILVTKEPQLVNNVDFNNETPLFYCLRSDQIEIFKYLLSLPNVDTNIKETNLNMTILQKTIKESKYEFASALIFSNKIDFSEFQDPQFLELLIQCKDRNITSLFDIKYC